MNLSGPFLEEIFTYITCLKEENNCDIPFFRGHARKTWNLIPTLFREKKKKKVRKTEEKKKIEYLSQLEDVLFHDFRSLGAPHIDPGFDSWDILFLMRHYGLPTRILDWTENFSVALFFALYDKKNPISQKDLPCIWILDPFQLNEYSIQRLEILEIDELKEQCEYQNYLRSPEDGFGDFKEPIALYPKRNISRFFSQKCAFTLHFLDMRPLEEILVQNKILKKFEIPENELKNLKSFLSLAGINEYSVFPDLQGLSDYLNRTKIDETL